MDKLKCKCGKTTDRGYSTYGNYFWIGCDPCGLYALARTSFGLLKSWLIITT